MDVSTGFYNYYKYLQYYSLCVADEREEFTMKKRWLLAIDLDGTLWDCKDISRLDPPFEKINEYSFRDSKGRVVNVYKEIVELIKWARDQGAVTAVISWNNEGIAVDALRTIDLLKLLDYYVIEDHPRKDLMARKLYNTLLGDGLGEALYCVIYIDDVEDFLHQVSRVFPNMCALRAWRDFTDAESLRKHLFECLAKCSTK
ncbi:MAG: magnesium-dependent phosphatase-1 [Desulfurococcaceae archaeon]